MEIQISAKPNEADEFMKLVSEFEKNGYRQILESSSINHLYSKLERALDNSSDENSGLHKHGVNASTWKDKLEALIDGLEIENKEKLINDGDVETYKMLGEVMSSKIKQLKYWR